MLHDSIYSFLLVGYSCLLSAGVLHALLGLKVSSWCICGERCTPCPPTPLTSCSLVGLKFLSHFLTFNSLNIMWPRIFCFTLQYTCCLRFTYMELFVCIFHQMGACISIYLSKHSFTLLSLCFPPQNTLFTPIVENSVLHIGNIIPLLFFRIISLWSSN